MTTAIDAKRLTATRQLDQDGNPKAFRLGSREEQITLEPGKTWAQLDAFKWTTRGLIEEPRGFHVLPGGAVQLHGEQVELDDPEALTKLEHLINERLEAAAPKPSRPAAAVPPPAQPSGPRKVRFKVRLDKLGHLMITSFRDTERTETGIRGLETLVRNGLMLNPKSVHIDPLLRYVEIDEARFDSNASGAEALETRLNNTYAPTLKDDGHAAIEIRQNTAAASGFDIHFHTFRAGARFEVKGHLAQEQLDILQDPVKCQLLRAGIVLRISPPHLIIRRRRPDGGEERIPELPDVHYLRITAAELQRILNHPLLRRGSAGAEPPQTVVGETPSITQFRLVRNPQTKTFLSLEIVSARGTQVNAFTHHNIAELQQKGIFRSKIEVLLSLDNRTLTVIDGETQHEERIVVEHSSADADLLKAAQLLTAALKPVVVVNHPLNSTVSAPEPVLSPAVPEAALEQEPSITREAAHAPLTMTVPEPVATAPSVPESSAPEHLPLTKLDSPLVDAAASSPEANPAIRQLFAEPDWLRTNIEIFRHLEAALGAQAQSVWLSLERVFQDRHFEIVSSTHTDIMSVLEIRSDDFAGFYLSQINDQKILLDFAYEGKRLEWGPQKCCFQSSVTSDPDGFDGPALLGMALAENGDHVFIVVPEFKEWIMARKKAWTGIPARFITVDELARGVQEPDHLRFVWPLPD